MRWRTRWQGALPPFTVPNQQPAFDHNAEGERLGGWSTGPLIAGQCRRQKQDARYRKPRPARKQGVTKHSVEISLNDFYFFSYSN